MRDAQKLYKHLGHIEHILLRPERHLGSTKEKSIDTWVVNLHNANLGFRWVSLTYRPVLVKLFDEIILNSVDFSKTPEGTKLTKINIMVSRLTGSISVEDNGGIPVIKHESYTKGLLPDMLFGELFSSSNYNEHDEELANSDGAGQNGEGASLVNVFSKNFTVITSDGKKRYSRTWRNNMTEADSKPAEVVDYKGHGTTISFIPDYSRFHGPHFMTQGDEALIIKRAYEVAACNPQLEITLNGVAIRMNHFRDFSSMFRCDAVEETPDWKVGIFKSDSFQHHSYVNSVHTAVGGPHIDYVLDKIIEYARPKLKRAFKVDYKPGAIKGSIGLVLVCNIKTPRFDGQLKENMTTKVSDFGTKWEPTKLFLEKAAAAIIKWMSSYHEDTINKEADAALEKADSESQKVAYHHIEKYERATSTDRSKCTLFLTEGDSAAKPILAARDTKHHGVYPLRGKILNVISASKAELAKSKEIESIMAIMKGLSLRNGVDFKNLRYQSIVISTDADVDGLHIRGLVCAAFMKLWPEFIRQGRLKFLITPVVVGKKGKTRTEFFSEDEFEQSLLSGMKFDRVKYLKGLGSNGAEEFVDYLNNSEKYHVDFTYDEHADESMDLAFNTKRPDDRKPLFDSLKMTDVEELG